MVHGTLDTMYDDGDGCAIYANKLKSRCMGTKSTSAATVHKRRRANADRTWTNIKNIDPIITYRRAVK